MTDEPTDDGTQVFSVRFFDEVVEQLDSIARARDRSRNYLIQEAVCEALGMKLQLIGQTRKDKRNRKK
jgi:predicted transcriptional regulator